MKNRDLVLLLFLVAYSINIHAQIPGAPVAALTPNAAGLGLYGDIPVSLYTGTPDISIPLYEIKVKNYTLPITLSYHASGVQVDQHPSWVGLGWSLFAGGLITRSEVAYAYLSQFDNTLPIWGVQRENELDEFISYIENPPVITAEIKEYIEKDRKELVGEFCRGCGYCMPCPAGIEINTCARMSLLLRRSPAKGHLSEEGQAKMKKIEDCIECGKCKAHCPYGLDTPNLLKRNYEDFKTFLKI